MKESRKRRSLDPVSTQRTILTAAVASFSEFGYAGTSFADVAKRAGVAKGLVQYHFETKEALWQAAILTLLGPFVERIDDFLANPTDPAEVVTGRFRLLQSHPELARFLAWMCLQPSPLPQPIVDRGPKIRAMLEARHSLEETSRLLLALSAMDGWFLFRRLYRAVSGLDLDSGEMDEAFLRTLLGQVGRQVEAAK